jgi:hypothetical protein
MFLRNASVFSPEDGGSMFLRNFGIYLQIHTVLLPRRPTLIRAEHLSPNSECGQLCDKKSAYCMAIGAIPWLKNKSLFT